MLSFNITPDQTGFKYVISSAENIWYKFDYLAICAGGHQVHGCQAGNTLVAENWISVTTTSPVIHVGVSGITVYKDQEDLNKVVANSIASYKGTPLLDDSSNPSFISPNDLHESIFIPYLDAFDNFAPYGKAFAPYEESFNSYLDQQETFSPYGQAFVPYAASVDNHFVNEFAPYAANFTPYGTSYLPYGQEAAVEDLLAPYGEAFDPYNAFNSY